MSIEMNKSPMEIKCEEFQDKYRAEYDQNRNPNVFSPWSFQAGFKAALELPEVKSLLNIAEAVAEINDDECYFDHHGYCQAHNLEKDCHVGKAKEALKSWKSFKGE